MVEQCLGPQIKSGGTTLDVEFFASCSLPRQLDLEDRGRTEKIYIAYSWRYSKYTTDDYICMYIYGHMVGAQLRHLDNSGKMARKRRRLHNRPEVDTKNILSGTKRKIHRNARQKVKSPFIC
jgi:hypothetical protein